MALYVFECDCNNAHFCVCTHSDYTEKRIKSYEGIVGRRPNAGFRLMASLFLNEFKRLLEQLEDDVPLVQFSNIGLFYSYDVELEVEKRCQNDNYMKVAWTYAQVSGNGQGGIIAADSPRNLLKIHYAEPLIVDQLRLGFEEIFVDDRRAFAGNVAPSYHLFNINLALARPFMVGRRA